MIEWRTPSHSETPVPVVNGLALASVRSPEAEAEKWLRSVQIQDGTTIAVLGFGSGVHIELLRQRYPKCKIVIYELHPELGIQLETLAPDFFDQVLEFRPAWGSHAQEYLEMKSALLGEYRSFQEFIDSLKSEDLPVGQIIQEFIR